MENCNFFLTQYQSGSYLSLVCATFPFNIIYTVSLTPVLRRLLIYLLMAYVVREYELIASPTGSTDFSFKCSKFYFQQVIGYQI